MEESEEKPKSLRSGKPVVSRVKKYMFNEFELSIIVSYFSFPDQPRGLVVRVSDY